MMFYFFGLQQGSNLDKVTGFSGHKETTAIHIYTHAHLIVSSSLKCVSLWMVGGSQRNLREPAHTQGEHADSVGHLEMIMGRIATLVFHKVFFCLFGFAVEN